MGDDYKINLQNRCRYGNCLLKEADYPVPKDVYTKMFLYLGCYITQDLSEVHPSKVCNKHKAVLIRVRNSAEQNGEFPPTTNIFAFQEHSQNCQLCANPPKIPGRKRKHLSVVLVEVRSIKKLYPKMMKPPRKIHFKLQSMLSGLLIMLRTFLGL